MVMTITLRLISYIINVSSTWLAITKQTNAKLILKGFPFLSYDLSPLFTDGDNFRIVFLLIHIFDWMKGEGDLESIRLKPFDSRENEKATLFWANIDYFDVRKEVKLIIEDIKFNKFDLNSCLAHYLITVKILN